MRTKRAGVLLALALACGGGPQAGAQSLTNVSLNELLAGDDPFVNFNFPLPFDPLTPVTVRFDGFFTNLVPFDTGVSFYLSWLDGAGNQFFGASSGGFVPLAGSGLLPVIFNEGISFTPAEVNLFVEGGGPGDYFRFVGELVITPVPEPGMWALCAVAAAGLAWRCFRRVERATGPFRSATRRPE